ncbi:hypothetical protein JCM8097_002365 [Rhodosporidiobolus ruineniae]
MKHPPAPFVTPSKPSAAAPVDISTIEAAKENIVPLHSGRSASQLAALSSSTRSGLGVKLDAEHARFAAQITAVETYEDTGTWEDGKDGLAADDVAQLAEDPLDINHQYVRFIVANYPAGASAANKLVPVLEATTRKFLGDSRYTNDPRYFRLWAHYAKNMENPEDCYRFLFAKGVGEKLAALYEEYAKVLEAKHKRKQADQVYNLGINRRATPLDRLKRSYLDFQARMLVAPPVPSPPRPSASSSAPDARSILSSSASSRPTGIPSGGIGVAPKGNGSMFAVFRDDAGASQAGKDAEWDDFGTVKSRTRENNEEKKEWAGEVMPQKGAATPKVGGFKLEVYRDETAGSSPLPHAPEASDVFSRSSRPTSEAELLRANPFKNYSAGDVDLLTRDPLEGLEVLPRASAGSSSKSRNGGSSSSSTQARTKSSSSSSRSSSSKTASSSSASAAAAGEKPKERVAVNMRLLYPKEGVEYSFEELKARSREAKYLKREVEEWDGWEHREKWDKEERERKRGRYEIDAETGWPVLFDKQGAPLYEFLPRPSPPRAPSPEPMAVEAPSPAPVSPTRPSSQPTHSLLSPSPPRAPQPQLDLLGSSPTAAASAAREPSSPSPEPEQHFVPQDPNRPPSPTINTRAANALLDHLFAKTLDFTKVNGGAASRDDSDDDEPSTEESDDDDEDDSSFRGVPSSESQSQFDSQFSTQGGATQQSEASRDEDGGAFVPFSQTRSQMADDSAFYESQRPGSQLPPASMMPTLGEEDENATDENGAPLPPLVQPMQLFRDAPAASAAAPSAVPATPAGAFRPVTRTGSSARAPLGMKSGTPLAVQPPKQPLFSVFQDPNASSASTSAGDESVFGGDVIPSSQPQEDSIRSFSHSQGGSTIADDSSFAEPEEYSAPLAGGSASDEEDGEPSRYSNDGYDLGRRLPGQSRYAPFVEQMTPIVERTLEFTAMTSLSTSQRSRRDSYYPTGAAASAVQEEEEPSTDEDDEDEDEDADRGFVASFASQPPPSAQAPLDVGEDSSFQSGSSSSDSDDDDEPPVSQHQPQLLPPSITSPPHLPHLAAVVPQGSPSDSRSFEVSLNNSALPEGLTITGNQSGMTTNMLVGNASESTRPSDAASAAADEAVIDPYDRALIASILERTSPSIFEHPDLRDLRSQPANHRADLQKTAKKREKSGKSAGKDRTGVIDEAWDLELNGEVFSVRDKLGEGAFGAVFRIALTGGDEDEDDFDVDGEDELSLAVKVERPANLWEFYVLDQLQQRLPERTRASVVAAQRLYAYSDESYLFLDYCDQGSLLDVVNRAPHSGVAAAVSSEGIDELLALFFVVELLRIVEAFHAAGFLHGDLKIDNCLVRLEDVPGGARAWSTTYDTSGANGWSSKGLKLIDFGQSIDLSVFPDRERSRFSADIEADELDCAEMREKRPWSFEVDYFGVASIAYNLLFGRKIETRRSEEGDGRWTTVGQLKRYHQVELWTRLFDALLNPRNVREDGALPITEELGGVRREMEEYLRENGEKAGKSLRGLIKKLEIDAMSR